MKIRVSVAKPENPRRRPNGNYIKSAILFIIRKTPKNLTFVSKFILKFSNLRLENHAVGLPLKKASGIEQIRTQKPQNISLDGGNRHRDFPAYRTFDTGSGGSELH